ncbi:MAG: hypothetical protein ACXAD7_09650 [Candidatus Kariarchaeaceae archaeon]
MSIININKIKQIRRRKTNKSFSQPIDTKDRPSSAEISYYEHHRLRQIELQKKQPYRHSLLLFSNL